MPLSDAHMRQVLFAISLVLVPFSMAFAQLDSALNPRANRKESVTGPALNLVDGTKQSRITFEHTTGSSGKRYIVETVVAGLATFDYNNDGWLDIYLLNGQLLPGTTLADGATSPRNALYRNNGDWTFTDVTESAGVAAHAYGMGVAAADYDQDGDQDLYIANFGQDIFYRNEGDGCFTDVSATIGTQSPAGFGTGVVWLDIENDGDLDLYAGRYVNFQYEQHQPRMIGGRLFHPGPAAYPPSLHELFLNNGDGTFSNISRQSGIAANPGPGMGAIAFDADEDNDIDLFVCNDGKPNFLFLNDGQGKFTEQAFLAGVAVDRSGTANGNMGVDAADLDGDGLLDLFTTDYQDEMPVLYRNLGHGQFEDLTTRARIDVGLLPHVKWGVGLVDFDNDADRDIFIACGHFLDNIRFIDDRTDLRVPNFLLANDGRGRFANATQRAGSGLQVVASSRGAAMDDLDNDGDVDVVVLNSDGPPTIIRNDSVTGNHWLAVELVGRKSNRSAAGAMVKLSAAGSTQVLAVHCGRSYQSHYGTRLLFGLGSATSIESLIVNWPSGQTQTLDAGQLKVDEQITIVEN